MGTGRISARKKMVKRKNSDCSDLSTMFNKKRIYNTLNKNHLTEEEKNILTQIRKW